MKLFIRSNSKVFENFEFDKLQEMLLKKIKLDLKFNFILIAFFGGGGGSPFMSGGGGGGSRSSRNANGFPGGFQFNFG